MPALRRVISERNQKGSAGRGVAGSLGGVAQVALQ
jgi:hypothetical protein